MHTGVRQISAPERAELGARQGWSSRLNRFVMGRSGSARERVLSRSELDTSDSRSAAATAKLEASWKRTKTDAVAPVGVVVLGDDQNAGAALEMHKLLRQPRYFDTDFEDTALRCFRCGGVGHVSRDCQNEARQKPCILCAQFGHLRNECPQGMDGSLCADSVCLYLVFTITSSLDFKYSCPICLEYREASRTTIWRFRKY